MIGFYTRAIFSIHQMSKIGFSFRQKKTRACLFGSGFFSFHRCALAVEPWLIIIFVDQPPEQMFAKELKVTFFAKDEFSAGAIPQRYFK